MQSGFKVDGARAGPRDPAAQGAIAAFGQMPVQLVGERGGPEAEERLAFDMRRPFAQQAEEIGRDRQDVASDAEDGIKTRSTRMGKRRGEPTERPKAGRGAIRQSVDAGPAPAADDKRFDLRAQGFSDMIEEGAPRQQGGRLVAAETGRRAPRQNRTQQPHSSSPIAKNAQFAARVKIPIVTVSVIMDIIGRMGKGLKHWHRATLSTVAVIAAASGLNWHGGSAPGGLTVGLSTPLAAARPSENVPPPQAFQSEIASLGEHFEGRVGIAIRSVSDGWTAGYRAALPAPQQSVSKLWVAIALLDAVDHGKVSLDDKVTVTLDDLTVFHQPIRGLIGPNGYSATLRELMKLALTQSDNTANDLVLRRLGGPDAIRKMFLWKQIDEVHFGPGERLLQAGIAGLEWKPQYALGNSFQIARAKLNRTEREEALSRYVASPPDAASPEGIVRALAALKRGELLSQASTALLLDTMASSHTGKFRLRAGVSDGWTIAHKTGTGQELGQRATGFNDVGVLTSPEGRSYTVAVMIADTNEPIHARQQLIAEVARRVITYDKSSHDAPAREIAHREEHRRRA